MDVKNAFLRGHLDRDIYMEQPKSFICKSHTKFVCILKKAMYRLKQSPKVWYGKIAKFLVYSGYNVSSADSNLFIKAQNQQISIVLIYVDDHIITVDNINEIQYIRRNLGMQF